MPDKLRALDLFCKAGGAGLGLHRAGFEVTGIDIEPQPRYPFAFIQADALKPPVDLGKFDLIWSSPPCQAYTIGAKARERKGAVYHRLIEKTRSMLAEHPLTVIENVIGAPVRPDLILHGHMFPELKVIRRRKFELSWDAFSLVPPLPKGLLRDGYMSVVGTGTPSGIKAMGLPNYKMADLRVAMGIDWMNRAELSQAIPPAYSEFIGRAALRYIDTRPAMP